MAGITQKNYVTLFPLQLLKTFPGKGDTKQKRQKKIQQGSLIRNAE